MKTLAFILLGSLMGIGAYALVQATVKEQAEDAARAAQVRHCELVNQQIIREFDDIVDAKKFPSQDQQDYWRQISRGCEE